MNAARESPAAPEPVPTSQSQTRASRASRSETPKSNANRVGVAVAHTLNACIRCRQVRANHPIPPRIRGSPGFPFTTVSSYYYRQISKQATNTDRLLTRTNHVDACVEKIPMRHWHPPLYSVCARQFPMRVLRSREGHHHIAELCRGAPRQGPQAQG